MEDESIFIKKQPKEISEGLQGFIDSMVEEIVLEGKPFDSQKKYLKKFSENEGLDYEKLEVDITTFIEILESLKTALNKLQVKLAEEKGKECHISEDTVQKLVKHSSQPHQKEQEKTLIDKKDGTGKGGSLNKTFLWGSIGLLLLVVILLLFKWYSDNNVSKSDTEVNIQRDSVVNTQYSSEAEQQFRSDAERGDAEAQYCLGYCYYCGAKGLPKSYSEAIKWFTKAANQGYARAQYELGYCYEHGLGVSQNLEEAKLWYEKAADQGYSRAVEELAGIKRMESQAIEPQIVELTIPAPSWGGKTLSNKSKKSFMLKEVSKKERNNWGAETHKNYIDEYWFDEQVDYKQYWKNKKWIGEKDDRADLSMCPSKYKGLGVYEYLFYNDYYVAFYQWSHQYTIITDYYKTYQYRLDFSSFQYPPRIKDDAKGRPQRVNSLCLIGDKLYVGHRSETDRLYFYEKCDYISCIDLETGKLIWTTLPLTYNSSNFIVVDDVIICGYGYVSKKSYVYLIDIATGQRIQEIIVNGLPELFVQKADQIHVQTYENHYIFDIVRQ